MYFPIWYLSSILSNSFEGNQEFSADRIYQSFLQKHKDLVLLATQKSIVLWKMNQNYYLFKKLNHYGLKCYRFLKLTKVSRTWLLENESICIVIRFSVMLQIFIYHFVGDISGTPTSKAYSPKMTTPISLVQYWKFLL